MIHNIENAKAILDQLGVMPAKKWLEIACTVSTQGGHGEGYSEHKTFGEREIVIIQADAAGLRGLRPIETAPKDGTYILLFGNSGYGTTPLRCEICRHDSTFRPLQPWVNHSNDSFLDGGSEPTHWMPLPLL